jgi:hypothetical protein
VDRFKSNAKVDPRNYTKKHEANFLVQSQQRQAAALENQRLPTLIIRLPKLSTSATTPAGIKVVEEYSVTMHGVRRRAPGCNSSLL